MMIYFFVIILVLISAFFLLHLRLKLRWNDDNRSILFFGLGQSGLQYDFEKRSLWLVFRGRLLKEQKKEKPTKLVSSVKKVDTPKDKKKKKKLNWRGLLQITPALLYRTGEYLLELVKSLQWEEANAKITAGFEEPDLTGITFGYYQATIAAVPSLYKKIEYQPVWHEQTFSGSARLSVSLPLYSLIWKTIVYLIKLPLRKIIKLAIGYKRGVRDDK